MIRLLLSLSLLPSLSVAAELHKCLAAGGQLSYQSEACPAGARTLWVRDVLPEASPPRPAARTTAAPAPTTPAPARTKAARARPPSRDPQATRCAKARRAADLRRDREWSRLDFRQRSELDASVARACAR
ncbi:hypothetical protein [Arenimonas daejeonensis]|uniref:hypothetical protein n=1 Tax=Arenimonas daejeonensis TaxID=370777 RepID=UPI0011BDE630|nr:hypothetical protein [Arenimonas daejeonensis]